MDKNRLLVSTAVAVVAASLILSAYALYLPKPQLTPTAAATASPIHFHPNLTIILNGQKQTIPANIGITIGNNIDNEVSGMRMSPIHTHDDTGKLHVEVANPSIKPEVTTLGYFFKVWGKTFNSSCVFEFCNGPAGRLRVFVNGKENSDFERYSMKDGDEIVIQFG